jgi:hypothetical protein
MPLNITSKASSLCKEKIPMRKPKGIPDNRKILKNRVLI